MTLGRFTPRVEFRTAAIKPQLFGDYVIAMIGTHLPGQVKLVESVRNADGTFEVTLNCPEDGPPDPPEDDTMVCTMVSWKGTRCDGLLEVEIKYDEVT